MDRTTLLLVRACREEMRGLAHTLEEKPCACVRSVCLLDGGGSSGGSGRLWDFGVPTGLLDSGQRPCRVYVQQLPVGQWGRLHGGRCSSWRPMLRWTSTPAVGSRHYFRVGSNDVGELTERRNLRSDHELAQFGSRRVRAAARNDERTDGRQLIYRPATGPNGENNIGIGSFRNLLSASFTPAGIEPPPSGGGDVPEPSTWAMLGSGLIAKAIGARRKNRRK